jgi:hypothetical protein
MIDLIKDTNLPMEIITYIYSFRPILQIELLQENNDIRSCMINILENDFDNEINYNMKHNIYNLKITDVYFQYLPTYQLSSYIIQSYGDFNFHGDFIYYVKNVSNYYHIIDEIIKKIDFFMDNRANDYSLMRRLYDLILFYVNYSYKINYYYYSSEYE